MIDGSSMTSNSFIAMCLVKHVDRYKVKKELGSWWFIDG
jgi:hypothetical protein